MKHMLLLSNRPAVGSNATTILDHLNAIHRMPGFRVWEVSMVGDFPSTIDLSKFDAIGIHYTLHLSDERNHFFSEVSIDSVSKFQGTKCTWMHDEYRNVDATLERLRRLKVDTVFSVVPDSIVKDIYAEEKLPATSVETVLTGYVDNGLKDQNWPPYSERKIDVGYRARPTPFWLGSLAQEKTTIGKRFAEESQGSGLALDISTDEEDRLYGRRWIKFLRNTKAMLCVESGASIFDFDGSIEQQVDRFVRRNPDASFEDVDHIVGEADRKFVANCLSPKIFEAAACGTLIVAYPGEYSKVLTPWVHYVPLEKDFSNLSEVISYVKDSELATPIIQRAYDDLVASGDYCYDQFAAFCAGKLPDRVARVGTYTAMSFWIDAHRSPSYIIRNYIAYGLQKILLSQQLRKKLLRVWFSLPEGVQKVVRPAFKIIGR